MKPSQLKLDLDFSNYSRIRVKENKEEINTVYMKSVSIKEVLKTVKEAKSNS